MRTALPYWYGSRHNCEANCTHLDSDAGVCKFYGTELIRENSDYGEFFMCDDCVKDTYGEEELQTV